MCFAFSKQSVYALTGSYVHINSNVKTGFLMVKLSHIYQIKTSISTDKF